MIIEDPELKPTTAIKNTGISDPSTIRRLRDKFRENKEVILREMQPQRPSQHNFSPPENRNVSAAPPFAEVRTMALKHPREPARSESASDQSDNRAGKTKAKEPEDDSRRTEIYNFTTRRLLTDSLRTASAVWQMQMYVASQTIQSPFVRSLMHYQLAFSQSLLGLGGLEPSTRNQH